MLEVLKSDSNPSVFDSISAPMIGENDKIMMFDLKFRTSHLRNTGKEQKFSLNEKVMIMINPTF